MCTLCIISIRFNQCSACNGYRKSPLLWLLVIKLFHLLLSWTFNWLNYITWIWVFFFLQWLHLVLNLTFEYQACCYLALFPGKPWAILNMQILNLVLLIGIFSSSCDNSLRRMPWDITDDETRLVLVMAWCPSGKQAITWASVDPDPCRNMASLGHSDLNWNLTTIFSPHQIVLLFTRDIRDSNQTCSDTENKIKAYALFYHINFHTFSYGVDHANL